MARPNETGRTDSKAHVAGAAKRVRQREERYGRALQKVLGTYDGRLVLSEWIERFGTHEPVFNPNNSVMSHAAGKQECGQAIRAAAYAVDEALAQQMEREATARAEHDDDKTLEGQARAETLESET
jgi:hypothetical protein